jgi:hypothetical protein
MFPAMKYLPEASLLAASAIASGEADIGEGFQEIGHGAFTQAYGDDVYVVKGHDAARYNMENGPAWNFLTWFRITMRARSSSEVFAQACRKYMAPTVVLFECVVVQEKVQWMGNDFSLKFQYAVEELARMLGILDMHGENWGVTREGEVRMFDIMPADWFPKYAKFTQDKELARLIEKVEHLLTEELPKIMSH